MPEDKITIITGPTCSGKSALALRIAEEKDAEIISCDSVQVYRGMDIGSAKPTREEQARVRHHLVDVAEPDEVFDVARYVDFAKSAVADIFSRGKKIVVVGGSGFYLKAWFCAVTDEIEIPQEVKARADSLDKLGADALADALLEFDSDAGNFVDLKNPRRTKNFLMRCLACGKSVAQQREDFLKMPPPIGEFKKDITFLNPPDEILQDSIQRRTRAMLDNGLVEECRKLLSRGIKQNPSASSAIGYRETIAWIENGSSSSELLLAEICKNTFALVKKQRKFFRGQLGLL